MTDADFSFCESIHATSISRWHIRRLTDAGRKLGGGIDTPSLCSIVRVGKGWDLDVSITTHHLTHACQSCVVEYRRIRDGQGGLRWRVTSKRAGLARRYGVPVFLSASAAQVFGPNK